MINLAIHLFLHLLFLLSSVVNAGKLRKFVIFWWFKNWISANLVLARRFLLILYVKKEIKRDIVTCFFPYLSLFLKVENFHRPKISALIPFLWTIIKTVSIEKQMVSPLFAIYSCTHIHTHINRKVKVFHDRREEKKYRKK